ncbi:hypothetical protein CEXT_617391 [Caerostris extrusa]|uniref:Uncharacterized protein n=1 Tax=Caerostris extrusa TaxID=172846 RepID=A0AAV4PHL1_CAEEX|nr:hypothetical protein CEXT_617391 [Caerostris extrusa]
MFFYTSLNADLLGLFVSNKTPAEIPDSFSDGVVACNRSALFSSVIKGGKSKIMAARNRLFTASQNRSNERDRLELSLSRTEFKILENIARIPQKSSSKNSLTFSIYSASRERMRALY